jgi:DNA-binding response OmpR family regulator
MSLERILVVDDDPAILDAVGIVLTNNGYTVDLLPEGEKIFEYIGDFLPDLIILDVMLGAVNGLVLNNLIKTTGSLADIPVIMITASESMIKILNESHSPEDIIQKPFDIGTLVDRVRLKLEANHSNH